MDGIDRYAWWFGYRKRMKSNTEISVEGRSGLYDLIGLGEMFGVLLYCYVLAN